MSSFATPTCSYCFPRRDDKLLFDTECYCGKGQTSRDAETGVCSTTDNKQDAWDAWWFDLTTPACVENVQSVHLARMKAAKDKGCDGIDPDNVDSVSRIDWLKQS
jgi:hypothetical protein